MTVKTSARDVARAFVLCSAIAGLAACESDYGPARYSPYEAGRPAPVQEAVIVSLRPITIGPGTDVGGATAAGAVGGGVIGASLGGNWRGPSLAGGLIGAAVGALAGHEIAKGSEHQGFLYTVRMRRDGRLLQIAQPGAPIREGTPVFVSFGARVRIEPADGYPPPPPPPPPRY